MKLDRKHLPYLGFLIAFLGIFFVGMNVSDILGHDYFFTFPRLLTGNWHFAHQGLRPFMYTPQLCGGLPIYANAQDMFYSLPQFLSFVMDPWRAVLLSLGITMIVGYFGWYKVGIDILKLPLCWSHVLALVVIANGYYFVHMLIGHIVYHTLPLIGWGLWLLFDKRADTKKSLLLRAIAFAMLTSIMLHGGGYVVIVILLGTILVSIPFDLLLSRSVRIRCICLTKRLALSAILVLCLALSKLIAVYSYMRFFPRHIPFDRFPEGASTIGFFLKSFWAIPQSTLLFESSGIPDWGAVHEYSMFTSPIVAIGLLLGLTLLYAKRKVLLVHWRHTLAVLAYSTLVGVFFVQFTRGYGLLVTPLENAPLFSSWYVTMRYMYIPIILLSGVAVWSIAQFLQKKSAQYNRRFALGAMGITAIAVAFAYGPMLKAKDFGFTVPYDQIRENITSSNYRTLHTETVASIPGVSDLHGIFNSSTATPCYESTYWGKGGVELEPLFIGTVEGLFEGQFNMFNPACLVYPEANDCEPGDRIALEDHANLKAFQRGQRTTWKISGLQKFGTAVSSITALCMIGHLVISRKKKSSPHEVL